MASLIHTNRHIYEIIGDECHDPDTFKQFCVHDTSYIEEEYDLNIQTTMTANEIAEQLIKCSNEIIERFEFSSCKRINNGKLVFRTDFPEIQSVFESSCVTLMEEYNEWVNHNKGAV